MKKINLSFKPISFKSILLKLKNFFSSAAVVMGIDIGSSSLKIAELKKTKGGYTLNNFVFLPIPAEIRFDDIKLNQFLINALKNAKREGRISGRGAFLCLGGQEVNLLFLTVPKVGRGDLKSAIILEAKKQISFDPKNTYFDFQISSEVPDRAGPKLQVIVAMAQKKVVAGKIEILREVGLQVLRIDILPNALANILEKVEPASKDEVAVLLDIGARATILSIFKAGKLEFSRDINTAGDHLTQALVRKVTLGPDKEINITLEQAEKIKRDCGIPGKDELEQKIMDALTKGNILSMLKPTLERLTLEILRSLNYYRQTFKTVKIDRMLLSGGSSRLKNIEEFLSTNLKEVKIGHLDPLNIMSGWTDTGLANQELLEELAPQLAVAFGLAARRKKAALDMDLLPQEVKIQEKLASLKTILKITVPIITGVIFSFYAVASAQLFHYRQIRTQANNTIKSFESTKELILEYTALEQKMEERKILLDKAVGRQPLWWGVLKELGLIHPEGITLNTLSVLRTPSEPLKLKLEGEVAPTYTTIDLALSQYLSLLDESPFYDDVQLTSTLRDVYSQTPEAKFEIVLRLVY